MAYNIIFYFTDQQRWDTCGCFGQPLDITPNLDRLAREGVKFDNAFSPQPVCGPCRALFQTGRYATDTGCFRNNIMLPANVKTLANYLEEAGYETAYVGKWHLASDGDMDGHNTVDHTVTAVPRELRGGYTGYWRAGVHQPRLRRVCLRREQRTDRLQGLPGGPHQRHGPGIPGCARRDKALLHDHFPDRAPPPE